MRPHGTAASHLGVERQGDAVGQRTGKVAAILAALADGPRSNAELCDLVDEIPSYLSRTMAKLRHSGRVANIAERKGRGTLALYALPQGD